MVIPSGKHLSYWIDSTSGFNGVPLLNNIVVDVAVVGGGIAGLTTALLLKQAGKTVAVLEADRVASAASGHTTAKITSLHQLIYAKLIDQVGRKGAQLYADSNQAALAQIAEWVIQYQIECDFSREDAYTFAETLEDLPKIKDEVTAAQFLGLPASFVEQCSLPFEVVGAIKFENQAQFHVRKYLLHLARLIDGDGSRVFESTRVIKVDPGNPCTVIAEGGTVMAKDVVITTNLPILDQGLFFAKTYPKRSYIVAAKIEASKAPRGMFIGIGDNYRSIRTTPYEDGQLLLIGGEGHKVGSETPTEARYLALERYGRETFGIDKFDFRWSSQDVKSFDDIPYVGPLTPIDTHIFVATGFSLWGMTNGTLAGILLRDRILGHSNPWASLYESTRATPFLSGISIKENLDVSQHWIGDRIEGLKHCSLDEVGLDEGKVVTVNGEQLAVYRSPAGRVQALTATCPHLGCIVNWNEAEKSWDCPCHGGRFSMTGNVLNGPPVKDLESRTVSETG